MKYTQYTLEQQVAALNEALVQLATDHPEYQEEGTTGYDMLRCLQSLSIQMMNEMVKKAYPIPDETWPSRRWNKEMTDYEDLSGE